MLHFYIIGKPVEDLCISVMVSNALVTVVYTRCLWRDVRARLSCNLGTHPSDDDPMLCLWLVCVSQLKTCVTNKYYNQLLFDVVFLFACACMLT